MLTDTRPICAAVKPASTQNGFTMKPIAASGSLKIRMNMSTGTMPGRRSSSSSAPNTTPPSIVALSLDADAGAPARAPRARPASATRPASASAPAAAHSQKPSTRSDHFVTPLTSHTTPSANAATAASANGERAIAAISPPSDARGTTICRSGGAVRLTTASPKKITAAHTNAPLQPIASDAISTAPDASMPTRYMPMRMPFASPSSSFDRSSIV